MDSSNFRAEARKNLTGKWGKVALISLIYLLVFFVCGFISNHISGFFASIVNIAILVIEVPLAFGLVALFMKVYNGEDVNVYDFFQLGFNNFAKAWKIFGNMLLKLIVPVIIIVVSYILIAAGTAGMLGAAILGSSSGLSGFMVLLILGFILLIIGGIWGAIKSYYYQLSMIIAVDKEELSAKDAVDKSAELMNGNRWKLFCLHFSFIGWAILSAITFGIGMLWLLPYMQFAIIVFYKSLLGNSNKVETTVVKEESSDDEGPIKDN